MIMIFIHQDKIWWSILDQWQIKKVFWEIRMLTSKIVLLV